MAAVRGAFDFSHVREFPVEAGRPDCTTPEKLAAIREGGATRISINPQTLSDEVQMCIRDRVVTDHHLAPAQLPEAAAVVDPQQPGDESGCGMLAGTNPSGSCKTAPLNL